jgi:hypothetical protein
VCALSSPLLSLGATLSGFKVFFMCALSFPLVLVLSSHIGGYSITGLARDRATRLEILVFFLLKD